MVSEQSAMWWVAHVIIVSAQGPNPSFFSFFGGLLFDLGACWDQDLDQGLTISVSIQFCISLSVCASLHMHMLKFPILVNDKIYYILRSTHYTNTKC